MVAPRFAYPNRKLRVLGVHGFRTNAKVMEGQTAGLRRALGPNVEYVFLNAPFLARGPPNELVLQLHGKDAPFYEWWQSRYIHNNAVADKIVDIMSGAQDTWNLRFEDLDRSLFYMEKQLQQLGPFDLAVGFSQGATMLTIFSMWSLQKRKMRWWRLAVCVSGVRVHADNCRHLFETADGRPKLVAIPSIHVAGTSDSICYETYQLAEMYETRVKGSPLLKTVLEHDGGHRFPAPRKYKELYAKIGHLVHQFFHYSDAARLGFIARL
ncbi:hypothetical protein BBJ28_00005608 [Nothophytophthora sp. Chile5]|nr:hypothetical protein BBJ28_00005608 [Nothophytophthora sp. Chile5]